MSDENKSSTDEGDKRVAYANVSKSAESTASAPQRTTSRALKDRNPSPYVLVGLSGLIGIVGVVAGFVTAQLGKPSMSDEPAFAADVEKLADLPAGAALPSDSAFPRASKPAYGSSTTLCAMLGPPCSLKSSGLELQLPGSGKAVTIEIPTSGEVALLGQWSKAIVIAVRVPSDDGVSTTLHYLSRSGVASQSFERGAGILAANFRNGVHALVPKISHRDDLRLLGYEHVYFGQTPEGELSKSPAELEAVSREAATVAAQQFATDVERYVRLVSTIDARLCGGTPPAQRASCRKSKQGGVSMVLDQGTVSTSLDDASSILADWRANLFDRSVEAPKLLGANGRAITIIAHSSLDLSLLSLEAYPAVTEELEAIRALER